MGCDTFTIKFSHKYRKLIDPRNGAIVSNALLLDVVNVDLKTLSSVFLDYDTDNGVFELPSQGKYMMLIFEKSGNCGLFTTLRRHTPDKELFYRNGIGQVFDIGFKTSS